MAIFAKRIIVMKKTAFAVLIFLFFLSCKKDKEFECYTCKTTYIVTTDVPVEGYPATTTMEVDICNVTEEQVRDYELINRGSETSVINNVTYSSTYSTICTK